ncbi:protease m1 zinc metalloprotease [Culex quinquefasciatus]|uniref:Aminopeptidase n=1 Tax=Culex quinquefasciatus TaxID=7176 RepID=B0W1Y1_CULQU|nr:protease m1 zinc metalloprotease [Culex quinquefasciatus]|eukprot:XP_001842715.1 protease m1 zinc metalloprotease [Culex quinquefasciatus]
MDKSALLGSVSVVLVLLLVQSCSTVRAQVDGDNYRLPNNSYPLRYDLELTTYVHEDGSERQFRFDGKVKIELIVKDDRNSSITVHYRQTTITHVKLWSLFANGTENVLLDDDSSFTLDGRREFLTVTPTSLHVGTLFLEIEYYGELRKDNAGFYRSSYVDDTGRTRWLATTQFSSTDARHAFPCYDEPGIRAPIGLTVIHGEQYMVLSNNLPKDSTKGPLEGYQRTVFEDTPVMQPYLLGIIVSDFQGIPSAMDPRQSVYARYNAIRNGEANFILEAGTKILNILEQYLQTPFALPKIYQVAVPDFAAGAMENYGLVTYKEEKFFYDSQSSPMKQQHEIATVVGHEFGHQYFGNMVSPAWWSYLWMKEGFARFFEYFAADIAYPELKIRETYTVQKLQNAFDLDSLGSSRPMTYYVNTQTEIANVFDNIAYDKGGSIMRMFQHAFGPDTFRQALINYLRDNAFTGANPENFAWAIQQAIDASPTTALPQGVTAFTVLKSWTEQSGYPVLHVSRGNNLQVTLSQERYLLKTVDVTGSTWIVPYNFATSRNPNFDTTTDTRWLLTNSTVLPPEGWSSADWIIINKQQTGYYRVNYDERLWNLIIMQLQRNSTIINNINRAQLIDDSLNLARSGRLGYDIPLRLIASCLVSERNYVPWAAANQNLAVLDQTQVDPDLRSAIYCYGLKEASKDVFLAVWTKMQTSKDQSLRSDLIYALGCAESNELKQLFLNTSIADEANGLNYFGQERERIFSAIYSNGRNGMQIALNFFMENFRKINELYNKGNFGGRAIGSAITGMAKYIVDIELNGHFQQLIETLKQEGLLRDTDILRALEQSSENLQWVRTKAQRQMHSLELQPSSQEGQVQL